MIVELQKKLWRNGLDLTEKTLDTLYKDKAFLQMSSMGLNMGLWWQKSCSKGASWLFKGLNVPTEDHLKELLENLHNLEAKNDQQEDRIKELEEELFSLKEELIKSKGQSNSASKDNLKNAKKTTGRKTTRSTAGSRAKKAAPASAYSH
jgi:TolA-binding protein